ILNHATFKGSLFMVAGIVDLQTGTRDIRKLGGLFTLLPMTATLALFGTFSMAGIPLPFLNGFYSKEMFFDSTLQLPLTDSGLQQVLTQVVPYLAVFGSIFTFVYSMYLFFGVFGSKKHDLKLPKTPKEAPLGMLIPPAILVLGVITIGLFPNAFNGSFLAHAAGAINPFVKSEPIQFWHGLNTPFIMSLIVVGVGLVLYGTRSVWTKVYNVIPGQSSFNRVYDRIIKQIDHRSARITNSYMNGSLKTYISLIIGTIVLMTTTYLFTTDGFIIQYDNLADISVIEIVVVVLIVIASIATVFTNHNLAALLITGIVGYGVSILFLIYRAPDLALTQLVIETVSVVLFLLAFYHLPKMRKRDDKRSTKIKNAVIAIGFGTLMTLIGISAHSSNWFEPISDYFLETAQSIGGGTNVVNVILVDMRGLDTLFEITVLGIAALAVFSLIKLRKDKEADK
ncbi:MAG TPA: hydrogen gas-evolving membrane-bound hydrogenase subunit E, partial [Cerasibacillus sp.]|uniref:hydrogen gas-evolving membrane-bound hydrogenase subunit E n=1 Tax=Cerasibacillus sp. TaxID=2498711 RepID=UPI002F3FF4CC